MNFFNFDIRKWGLGIVLFLVALVALNTEAPVGQKPWFVRSFAAATGVIQNLYSSFSSDIRGTTSLYLNLIDIKKENLELRKTQRELEAQLGTLTELKLENERLNALLDFKKESKMDLLAAKVIGKDLLPDHNSLVINRGSAHGIKEFMGVITIGGVVGYIVQPQQLTSQVLLITDRSASVDALVQRSRARGIVEGVSGGLAKLSNVQRDDDIVTGDRIVTSGLDNIFPKGYIIGTVANVEKNVYDVSQDVALLPTMNAAILEEVFVVLNTKGENLLPPEEESHP